MSNKVYVDNKWIDGGEEGGIIRIFVSGLIDTTDLDGWDELPDVDQTENWFGVNREEAERIVGGLLPMLNDTAVSQG